MNHLRRRAPMFLLPIGLAFLPAPASAQAGLPPARDLVDRHIEAAGSRLMVERGNIRITGTFTMAALGTTGRLEVVQAGPNRIVATMEVPGLGAIRSGFDGQVGWSMNPMEGPRLLTGLELAQARDDADLDSNLRAASLVDSLRTVERTAIEGTDCYKVRVSWKSGRESFDCYDVESGLLIATLLESQTAMGPVMATLLYSGYEEFDGVRIATTTVQRVFNQELVLKVDSVSFAPIDSVLFALPPEIRALVGK